MNPHWPYPEACGGGGQRVASLSLCPAPPQLLRRVICGGTLVPEPEV